MRFKKLILLFFCSLSLLTVARVFAQTPSGYQYTPLVPSAPYVNQATGKVDVGSFVTTAIQTMIAVAGVLSVIFIMIGGIQYMTTDSFGGKGNAKSTIQHAIFGFLLAIGAYVILYTINPNLLSFNLTPAPIPGGAIDTSGLGTNTGGTLPTGNPICTNGHCSAYDSGCITNCTAVTNLPMKTGQACSNDPCFLNSDLINKLQSFNTAMGNTPWQITEAFPPTVDHDSSCHNPGNSNSGQCADISLIYSGSSPSISDVAKFLGNIISGGFSSFIYEVCDETRKDDLQNSPLLTEYMKSRIQCEAHTTGEHAHVNL